MKITKTQLKNLIKEELEENYMYRSAAETESENNLVNAVLDLEELRGPAYVVNVLKEMIISIEAGR
tara:strand:+ start:319 stop:516 length:198 start_codon:yes stop_codon:yes gene_type:complete